MMINTMVRITFNINYWLCIINMYIAKLSAQLVNIKYISEGEETLSKASLESGIYTWINIVIALYSNCYI